MTGAARSRLSVTLQGRNAVGRPYGKTPRPLWFYRGFGGQNL